MSQTLAEMYRFINKNITNISVFPRIENSQNLVTSGSVMLALSHGKNVIVPRIGCCEKLAGENIYGFGPDKNLEQCINAYIQSFTIKHP